MVPILYSVDLGIRYSRYPVAERKGWRINKVEIIKLIASNKGLGHLLRLGCGSLDVILMFFVVSWL